MNARFRVRTRDERELRPATLDAFFDLVRSGEIDRDDLVHDTLTGEWAPAWAHPVFQLVMDPLVSETDEPSGQAGSGPAAQPGTAAQPEPAATPRTAAPAEPAATPREAAPAEPTAPPRVAAQPEPVARVELSPTPEHRVISEDAEPLGFEMELVESAEPSAEEAAAEFVRKMNEEREAEGGALDFVKDTPLLDPRTGVVEGLGQETPEEPAPYHREVRRSDPAPDRAPPPEPRLVRGPITAPGRARRSRRARWFWWVGVAGALGLALAMGSTVARASFRVNETLPARELAAGVRGPRAVSDSEESVRARAWTGFLARVDHQRADSGLDAVPGDWLEGHYLAQASLHNEVRRFWEDFLRYAENVHRMELDLYRSAYLEALDRARVEGPVRSMRLAAAVRDFASEAAERDEHYARVWELGVASLDLHDLLVELEGRVTFEPAEGGRLSADPVIEAVGADEEAQERLDAALDRVLAALQGVGAERTVRDEAPRWVVAGLK